MASELEIKLKAAYLKWSYEKYIQSRKQLIAEDGSVTIYAHMLDGCPLRHIFQSRFQLRRPDLDRGDSFETGFGVVHGLPQGIEVCVDVSELCLAYFPRAQLCGTPDFLAVSSGDLRVLDAKSPRRRKLEDGPKGYWRTRLQTYAFIFKQLRQQNEERARKIVLEAAQKTPYGVFEDFVGEWTSGEVHVAVIVDDPSIRSYRILEFDHNDDNVKQRLLRFVSVLKMVSKRDKIEKNPELKSIEDSRDERECLYCPQVKCPFNEARVVLISYAKVVEKTSEKGNKYFEVRGLVEDYRADANCMDPSDDNFLLTSDAELARFLADGGRVIAKLKKDDVWVRRWIPAQLAELYLGVDTTDCDLKFYRAFFRLGARTI